MSHGPSGGVRLNVPHHVGQRQRGGELREQMDVVGDPADADGHASHFSDDASQIRMQPLLKFQIDERLAMLGAEDDVEMEPCEGVRHEGLRKRNEGIGGRVLRASDWANARSVHS